VIVVPPPPGQPGPWLDATRSPSLQRVANRPIVEHVLDALIASGVGETAVLVPPGPAEEIAACIASNGLASGGVRCLVHDHEADPGGAVALLAEFAGDAPLLMHRADGLLGQPLAPILGLLEQDGADAVLLIVQGARNGEGLGPVAQRALRVAELDPANAAFAMAGVCVLRGGSLGQLTDTDAETFVGGLRLGAITESLLARESFHPQFRVVREWHAFGGLARDLLDMNRTVLDALDYEVCSLQSEGNRFEGRVLIDATASVTSSVICGPVIVGPGAHVADSYIGPHTSIGEGVRVEGAEIERSIVFAGASILHVGGRMVASVVGREARVFRDFSVPRALRLQVGDGDEVALC
jgi:glucose-1-phosphate thymidylyltransferase